MNGGPRVRTAPFPVWPQFDDSEREALVRALDHGSWCRYGGVEVDAFEGEFAKYHHAAGALAVTNGSHALELALELIGLRPGDEVIVPAYTFIATSTAVHRRGGIPVPVDVDPVTHCLDPAGLEAVATDRTRAVIPVHMGGLVADMDAINAWAEPRGIPVIQDAAHAHGAMWRDRGLGELSTMATFSFQKSKVVTAGEGGALLLPGELYGEAFSRHSCGRAPDLSLRTASSNFRLSEFSAAVLRVQLGRLAEQTARRERRHEELTAVLAGIPGVIPQGRDERCTVNPHYMTSFVLDPGELAGLSRDTVVQALLAEGIPAFGSYPAIYRTEAFRAAENGAVRVEDIARRCPNAEELGARGIMIPHQVLLGGHREIDDVAKALAKVLAQLPRTGGGQP
ncbi:DegT/DnrJ/EryC1/StrS family aminotransferase [Streptomyces sp. 205]|uniref:DegT/DnrJ/EryC1/StrS family aminotransferase n=2 Tax=Streptomyces coffeae TaxID=621382 RepID=A0ABS1NRA3_9ACTN|nr:DegT/DnrJ/EryC1/StrS family aminotransferase [Streptomyces coffeae]